MNTDTTPATTTIDEIGETVTEMIAKQAAGFIAQGMQPEAATQRAINAFCDWLTDPDGETPAEERGKIFGAWKIWMDAQAGR